MKNKPQKIKHIFIKKMIYSSFIQLLVLGILIFCVRNFADHKQLDGIANDLLIKDQYSLDQIGNYHILGNKYALDLELHNIGEMKKLDSIQFYRVLDKNIKSQGCEFLIDKDFRLCKKKNNIFFGITAIKSDQKILGYLVAHKKYNPIFSTPIENDLLLLLLIVAGTFVFNFWLLFHSLKNRIETNTELLLKFISSENDLDAVCSRINITEYKMVAQKFIDEKEEIKILQKEKMYYEARKAISEQFAHDIRSPIAVINIALSHISSCPEKIRIMIRNASKRMNDIANVMLIHSKNNLMHMSSSKEEDAYPELIFSALDSIVSEKRYEYHNSQIDIDLHIEDDSYHCFSTINLASFKRVLSNLINNSIEACESTGCVDIYLQCDSQSVEVSICDTGRGIPSDILTKVTEQGFSHNKKNGVGIGLSYAKQYIEGVKGKITIESEEHIGTKVILKLLKSSPPNWFCEKISILADSPIVVLDDDSSIHDAWDQRFTCIPNSKILHFSSIPDLLGSQIESVVPILYLIDYELLNDTNSGLDFIEEFQLQDRAILVTSAFEDIALRNRCIDIGIKIIPKSLVPYTPIFAAPNHASSQVVFIDDDGMMRFSWVFAAENSNIKLKTYSSFKEFKNEIHLYNTNTIIYIDSELGEDVNGETYAKELFELGFFELHLATGYPNSCFESMPWLKSIVSKEPPF